jgi:hypothetical protein
MAATAAEARFRINAAPQQPRAARVVALDAGARKLVRELAKVPWHARLLSYASPDGPGGPVTGGELTDIALDSREGRVLLSDELVGADFLMMIATTDDGASAAAAIGDACTLRGITTAGVVLGGPDTAGAAVNALRPHARMLLVTRDEQDVAAIMSAVGA